MASGGAQNESEAPLYRRIGHKGADAIVAGNTPESFDAAVEHGVDMVELDVLRAKEGRLIVAHDPEDAIRRRPMDLPDALDLFLDPPLDKVEIDCDLKLPGREAELAGALAGRGLLERTMVSTQEIESLKKLRQIEPDLRLGWTYPKTRHDWTQYGWARPALRATLSALRRRYPATMRKRAPELDIDAVWVYEPLITPATVEAADDVGVELIAWTVDDVNRMRELIDMGVNGIVSNDPRLFEAAEKQPAPEPEPKAEKQKPDKEKPEKEKAEKQKA
jgi:glycerophosphoryl diester phosphodiesterase